MAWEYHVHTLNTDRIFTSGSFSAPEVITMLNSYGQQGWELVSCFETAGRGGGTITIAFVFKRESRGPASVPPLA